MKKGIIVLFICISNLIFAKAENVSLTVNPFAMSTLSGYRTKHSYYVGVGAELKLSKYSELEIESTFGEMKELFFSEINGYEIAVKTRLKLYFNEKRRGFYIFPIFDITGLGTKDEVGIFPSVGVGAGYKVKLSQKTALSFSGGLGIGLIGASEMIFPLPVLNGEFLKLSYDF